MILYDPQSTTEDTTLPTYDSAKGQDSGGGGGAFDDFLSSLELQARKEKQEEGKVKTLNILNEFDFSSDSDELPSDVDDLPSDVDDLLDYANAEDDHGTTYRRVPRGGKWGPSGKLAASGKGKSKHHSPGKTGKYAPRTYGGKGSKLSSKLRSHSKHIEKDNTKEQKDESEEEEDPELAKEVAKLECKTCDRAFAGQQSYDRHLKTRFHKQKLNPKPKKDRVKLKIECPICEKVFNTKYNFARHLASNYHTRREAGHKPMVLDENVQNLLLKQSPIQCLVCSFYCNNMGIFLEHMQSDDHVEKCSNLSGPLLCLRCKFKVYSNESLLHHFESPEHVETIKSSGRPCIVKEVRYNVQCQVCHKDFHSAARLEQHLVEYHKKDQEDDILKRPPKQKGVRYKMPCPFCHKEWNSTFQLNIHIRRRHTKEKPFPCKSCGVAFTDEASLKAHEATRKHIDQQVMVGLITQEDGMEAARPAKLKPERTPVSTPRNTCQECDFTADMYGTLRLHYQAEHPEKVFTCKACNFSTFLETQFERHNKTPTHVRRQAAYGKRNDVEEEEEGDLTCSTCFKVLPNRGALQMHTVQHTTIMSEKQLRDANDGDPLVGVHPRFHEFWHTKCKDLSKHDKIVCFECNQSIGSQNIILHFRKHSETQPFQCPKCTLKFSSASSLRRHMQLLHLNIKLHQCKFCEEKFNRKAYLLTHLLRAHGDIADVKCPFVCSVCQKGFPIKHLLTTHMTSHSTEKLFVCDFEDCGKKYKSKSELQMHNRLHTGERPYVCEFCGYSAVGRQKLMRHLRTHTQERNYSCQYCSYKAQNSTHLHRHMRIHIGSKPYKCPYCPHTCNTHENIRKHILKTKRHRGLPCYPCQLCDFGTNAVKEYGQHLEEKHNQKLDPKGVLSMIAGLFNKDQDLKDIPEGDCALPVKEKSTKTPVKMVLERKRKERGMRNVKIIQHKESNVQIIQQPSVMNLISRENDLAQCVKVTDIQVIDMPAGQEPLEMVEYSEEVVMDPYENIQETNPQGGEVEQLQEGDLWQPGLETVHVQQVGNPDGTSELVMYRQPRPAEIVKFDEQIQGEASSTEVVPSTVASSEALGIMPITSAVVTTVPVGSSAVEMVPLSSVVPGKSSDVEMVPYTQGADPGNEVQYEDHAQYIMYTNDPQQPAESVESVAGEVDMLSQSDTLALQQEHVETVDSIKRAMAELNSSEHNLKAIEIEDSTLLQLGDSTKVQWVNEDGTVIDMHSNDQLLYNVVVMDGKGNGGQAGEVGVVNVNTGQAEVIVPGQIYNIQQDDLQVVKDEDME